jgi:hypothetical protein
MLDNLHMMSKETRHVLVAVIVASMSGFCVRLSFHTPSWTVAEVQGGEEKA